jgi:transposase
VRQTFEIPLDIPDVTIESVTTNRVGHIEITVKSTVAGTPWHQCGNMTTKFYGEDREITVRHLPILGRKTYIRLRPKRYQCPHCHGNPTTTQRLSWYTPRSAYTRAYEEQILLRLVNSTVEDVSIKEEIGYEAIMGIIDRHIGHTIDGHQLTRLEVIGLDEIALKKGHRNFVTIVTGRIEEETVIRSVFKDRQQETVKAFLSEIPRPLCQTLHAICSDMSPIVLVSYKLNLAIERGTQPDA